MPFITLISVAQLQTLRHNGVPHRVFDCSFDLMRPEQGPAQYAQAHISGASYAHLEQHLSAHGGHGLANAASGGRHPLPSREAFAQWLGSIGLRPDEQVVVYDRQGNNFCGRLWWMLRWVGHAQVAVLDGGLQAWQAIGGTVEGGDEPAPAPTTFPLRDALVALRSADTVLAHVGSPHQHLVDARSPARFRGETEPIDPVAGHIPGALNRAFTSNFGPDGLFKPAAVLRAEFEALLGSRAPHEVVHHCGSGVSAIPNVLAMEIAGLHGSALFAGSWSEWCNRPDCPVAIG